MTDSEASAPQDDSDEDIYKDFPEFNLEEELAKLEGSKETYKQEALDLSEKVKVLTEENKELKRLNEVLGRNISTLLKTAQTEVHRKDSLIEELRSKVDSFTFRRSNRLGRDKFTTTEDLEPVNNFKSECLECKKNRDKKRSKSYENRTSSESESKSCKGDTRKSDRYCSKEESKDCDNDKRLGHFREHLKLNYKRSGSDNDPFIDKQRGSQFNRYSRRESIVGRRSYRQDDRHHSKFDSVDKRGYIKRDSNEPRFSLRRRDSDKRGNSRRDSSVEKPRRSDARRNRSRSRNRTVERKESSSDKGKSRASLESDSLIRGRQEIRNKSKESESTRNCVKSDDSNKRSEGSERGKSIVKVTDKSKQVTKDRNSGRNEGRRNPESFETKSPLDALYNEMIVTRSTTRLSNPKSGSTKTDSELEEGEFVEDKLEQPGSSDESDEWIVPPKNDKPVTLYTKRMMEKISAQQALEKEQGLKPTGDTRGDSVNDEKVEPQIEETNMKDSVETERESGELTDDENVIESSKEFQEIAKVASAVDNKINRKPVKDDRKKIPEAERVFFKEPFKTVANNIAISNNVVTETKEVREIIEFSPFKNNYKLIEISPVKPPTGEHILDVYNKRLSSNAQTQKEVESKIFNLIMSLSGVPSDSNKTAEKTVSEGNEAQEIIANREEHQKAVENPEVGKKMSSKEKTNERKHESSSRRTNSRKSSKSKQTKVSQEKQEKEKPSKTEDEVVDSVTPGETTQFLDFFLRTTSPSKPIVPAEQEMEINEKREKGELDSTEKKTEGKENSTTVVNTSSEKESLNSSSSEIQGKESHSKTKSPKSINSKSKKGKSPLKKRNSNAKEGSKEKETGETKRDKSTESKKKKEKTSEAKADEKNGSSDETSRGRNKRKVDTQDGEKQRREEKGQKRKRTMSERDEETKKQKVEDRKTCHKKSKRDSKSEPEERSVETIKEDITSFEFFKPITRMETGEKNGGEDANKSGGDYKMTTTMSLTGVVCLETPNKCVEKVMINEQAIYHFMDSKANTTYSPLPCSKYPEMTPRRMLKNDLTLTDSDDSTNKPNQDEVDEEEAGEEEEGEEGVAVEEGEVEMSENENSDSDSDSGASAFVDLL